ncbi:MAG TPA: efflux RND transporter permease subunit [Vicinamibacteria bacterium]|nr:efflux RND transporter permease subunit [Vicinamibacteria bacterium]
MHKLAELCVKRPVFASVLILSLVVVGLFSYAELGVDRFPNVDFPFVTISTRLVGAAPEEIETEITDKIEEAVNTISGIDQLISVSSEGISVVTVQFVLEKDGDVAAQEVRDRVNSVLGELPTDVDPPLIEKIDPDASPVLSIVLSGPASARDITEFADKTLRRQIESTLGVGQVRIVGGRPRQINVIVDTSKAAGLGLTAAEVVRALQSQNVQLPGGKVEQGPRDLTLRTYGRVSSPEEFAIIPVAVRNGYPVRVGDVARVEDGMAEPETVATFDGEPAVVLQVRKQSGTNTIQVVELLKERIEQLRGQLPPGWKIDQVRDQSEYILGAVHAVQEHLILGSLFAAGIVFLFLGKIRPTIIAAVSIPSALIATFAAMEWMGFTLNVITLLALTLAVGIVIDDAVIVLEIIFRYMEEKKLSPREAAVEGTREVGLAVIAMTLSLIAVFLPVAFMAGIVGRFMNSFGVPMAFAIAVSLLVAFTLTPMMSARWLRVEDLAHGKSSRESRFYAPVERVYMAILRWSMRHRWAVVIVMTLTFASTVPLFVTADKNFIPNDDESQFEVIVRAPEGSSLETTGVIMESIASRIREYPEVIATLLTIGDDPQRTRNLGVIYVKLLPVSERERDQFAVMARIRDEILPRYAALELRAQVSAVSPFRAGSSAPIQFWVGGPDFDELASYAANLLEVIRAQPGVVDADTNLVVGNPELGVRIDRAKAADLGVEAQDIAATMNVLVGGLEVTDYYENGEQYEVHVRAEERYRRDAAGIVQAEVPSRTAGRVKLKDVVSLEEGTGPSLINRIARRRQVLITSGILPGASSQTVIDALNGAAADLNMPPGYSYGLTGRSREQGRAARNFAVAFLLSIIFMYLILAAQFESWLHPVTILLALPLTVPFALLSIVGLDQSINIFSALGILVLFGIVKKNGILQIDHMNGLREQGVPREEAILQANRDRLRPILMTTFAFVAGMIPLVLSSGTGAGTNRAIGSVVIGGQTLALVLTLIGTPVAYSIFDDWSGERVWARIKGWFRLGLSAEPSPAGAGRQYRRREV